MMKKFNMFGHLFMTFALRLLRILTRQNLKVLAALFVIFSLHAPHGVLAQNAVEQQVPQNPQPNPCGCISCNCTPDCGRPPCPVGQTLYDYYCVHECPPNFIRYPGYPGTCLPPSDHGCPDGHDLVPLPQCPDYYVRDLNNLDRCVPDYGRLNNIEECPWTMDYSSQTGRCEVKCTYGQYRDANGLCQSYYDRPCPANLARDPETGRCLPPGIWPPNYAWICLPSCTQGWFRDIYHPTRCLPPRDKCPDGSISGNGRCLPVCETGTERDTYGYCVPKDCPEGSYSALQGRCVREECPPNTTLIREQCVPIRQGCKESEEEVNGQCVPVCRRGERRDANGRCVPEQQGCKQGTEPYKGRCVEICGSGEKRNTDGRCVPVPKQTQCPEGYQSDGEGGCVRIVPLLPRACREGEVYSKLINQCIPIRPKLPPQTFSPPTYQPPKYQPPTYQPPSYKSPSIFKLNPGLQQLIPKDQPPLNQQQLNMKKLERPVQ